MVSKFIAADHFKDFENALKNCIKINSDKLYFYLTDGTPISSYLEIP